MGVKRKMRGRDRCQKTGRIALKRARSRKKGKMYEKSVDF